jgi:hypothetical protein
MLRLKALAIATMCAGGLMAAAPASAAPLGAAGLLETATSTERGVSKVHYRRYRHCHRRYGRRRCHGRRHYRRGYGIDLPGVSLYFGERRRHRHHRRRRWRD